MARRHDPLYASGVKQADARAFVDRPWALFEQLRQRRVRSRADAFLLAERLRESVKQMSSPQARALGRQLDLEHHLRLKQLLERAGAAGRR